MSHRTAWQTVGAVMIVLALVNFAAQAAIFPTTGEDDLISPAEETVEETNDSVTVLQDELNEDIGSITSVTGISVIVISMLFLVLAYGLMTGKPWGIFAQLALGADITFKLANIIGALWVGDSIVDTLPAIFMIIVEGFLIYLLFHYRITDDVSFDTKRGTPRPSA